jgi:lipopolysaccharide transport system ATP-binding protein
MSSDLAVEARGLTKEYPIKSGTRAMPTLRETINHRIRHPFTREQLSRFRALDDVSFDVRVGEAVGIIGRNGAGKSTLLKILSRITPPTFGEAIVRGSLGSLLEVGTGFHMELTGRENVFLNGTMLGLTRKEVGKRFDAIVEFSGVEKFLDVPVKRYSSGMFVRLAFSVAAHVEPSVLVIDEVLAVGDAEFQAKCLGRMSELADGGRTVFFVSHSMPAVARLCSRALYLDQGRVAADGRPPEVISAYLGSGGSGSSAERFWNDQATAPGDDAVRLRSVRVLDADGKPADSAYLDAPLEIELTWWVTGKERVTPHLHFRNEDNELLFVSLGDPTPAGRDGIAKAVCRVPANLFSEGRIYLLVGLATLAPATDHVYESDVVSFLMVENTAEWSPTRKGFAKDIPGLVRPLLQWEC